MNELQVKEYLSRRYESLIEEANEIKAVLNRMSRIESDPQPAITSDDSSKPLLIGYPIGKPLPAKILFILSKEPGISAGEITSIIYSNEPDSDKEKLRSNVYNALWSMKKENEVVALGDRGSSVYSLPKE